MKTKYLLISICIMFVLLGLAPATVKAACPPPGLPSGFWGYITTNNQTYVTSGDISAWVGGVQVAYYRPFRWAGSVVYALIVRADDPCQIGVDGGVQNDTVTFKFDGRIVGANIWRSGTNVQFNLTINMPIPLSKNPIVLPGAIK